MSSQRNGRAKDIRRLITLEVDVVVNEREI